MNELKALAYDLRGDVADIERLLRSAPGLDLVRVREYFRIFDRERELDSLLAGGSGATVRRSSSSVGTATPAANAAARASATATAR